jgi:hypothetical protein
MKSLKAWVVLAVMFAVGFLAFKLFPPYVGNYNLHADTDNMAMQYTYAQGSTDAIRNDVIAKAKDHDIVLTEENVDVERTSAGVTIDVHYVVPVQLPGRLVELKFEFSSGNKMLTSK